jgi:hypothetical protein
MVLGARADHFSAAPSTLSCSVTHFGIPSAMSETNGGNYWLSGDGGDEAMFVVLQPNFQDFTVRMTFVEKLAAGPKALFIESTKGRHLTDSERDSVRAALSERSTQIVAPLGGDGTLSYQDKIFDQQLLISCSPK